VTWLIVVLVILVLIIGAGIALTGKDLARYLRIRKM